MYLLKYTRKLKKKIYFNKYINYILKMERDNYNIPQQSCVYSVNDGDINKDLPVPFYGSNIYTIDPKTQVQYYQQQQNLFRCNPSNTIIERDGKPKFTLPLADYYKLSNSQVYGNYNLYE